MAQPMSKDGNQKNPLTRRKKKKNNKAAGSNNVSVEDDEDDFESIIHTRSPAPRTTPGRPLSDSGRSSQPQKHQHQQNPALEPYIGKLERYELFSTNQCYYLVACDKHNLNYRVLKMDRTLIEHPHDTYTHDRDVDMEAVDAAHRAKPSLRPLHDFLQEDPHTYTQEEIQDMLDMIHHGNRYTRSDGGGESGGGLKPLAKAYGIVGFIRFLDCYYLTLITRRAKIGSIGGQGVYTIKSTETFPLKPTESIHGPGGDIDHHTDPSSMLLNMWNRGKRSVGLGLTNREIAELRYQGLYQVVDFTKNFYFSYTYDLTRSLQENFLATTSQPFPPPPFKDMYAWNFFLTREMEDCINSLTAFYWVLPIIHGAFVQRKLNDYGRTLNIALIARRSRHFAGTRYLKRGVSEQGKVANDVEHEQIVHDEFNSTPGGAFSSFLQVRGSIPTYWTQESSVTMPKPPIELNRVDPTYRSTQSHFEDLLKRYNSPIIVLDLVKQSEKREREVRVGNEYRHALDYINTSMDNEHKIRYCALDYSHISKHRNLDVSTSLNEVSTWSVNQTGFFCSQPRWKIVEGGDILPFGDEDRRTSQFLTEQLGVPVFPMEQRGVLRTNCIDCLDRTNVAQFSAGVEALEQQLVVMGIRSSTKLDPASTIVRVLIDLYVEIGDHIALQYGGSEAHKKVSAEKSESVIHGPIGKHKELLTSIRRYYSNAFTDRLKQDAMNLLLGYYIPYRHTIPLWEMETDYYLHNLHVKSGRGTMPNMKTYQVAFGVEWNNDSNNEEVVEKEDVTLSPSAARKAKLARLKAIRRRTSETKDPATLSGTATTSQQKNGESLRIAQVRKNCKAQADSLSLWWKVAIQNNIQQRMWMQLGRSPTEPMLPPRFERLYQPDKLAQFDRFFARSWAQPVRRSHSAQQGAEEDEGIAEFRRSLATKFPEQEDLPNEKNEDGGEYTLNDLYRVHGYKPEFESKLKKFVAPHNTSAHTFVLPDSGERTGRSFVGRLGGTVEPCQLYEKYCAAEPSHYSLNRDSLEEFKHCLHDTLLHSDNVQGIRKLAESAHIGQTIRSGTYRGLNRNESAVEVTTIIQEQFNALSNLEEEGNGLQNGMNSVDVELRRRGFCTAGVREAVARGWDRKKYATQQYTEMLDKSAGLCRRSDVTTESSLELYASYFDDSTSLSDLELTYIMGRLPKENTPKQNRNWSRSVQSTKTDFVKTAAKAGYSVRSNEAIQKSKSPPLFAFDRSGDIPEGFEQINEALFARKDNKFMVFNGPGVESWHGTRPITKVHRGAPTLDEFSSRALLETVGVAFGAGSSSIQRHRT